jgi:hypothetical protein
LRVAIVQVINSALGSPLLKEEGKLLLLLLFVDLELEFTNVEAELTIFIFEGGLLRGY